MGLGGRRERVWGERKRHRLRGGGDITAPTWRAASRRNSPRPARSCSSHGAGRSVRSARSYTGRCCSGRCCPGCAGAWGSAWEEGVRCSQPSRPQVLGRGPRLLLLSSRPCLRLWRLKSRRARTVGAFLGQVGMGSSTASLPRHFAPLPHPAPPPRLWPDQGYPRVMLQDEHQAVHVQPALPRVSVHGQHWLPVGSKLGVGGVRATVLKRQHLGAGRARE